MSRLGLAVALVATFGIGATVAVTSGWTARVITHGQEAVERARMMWSDL